MLCASVVLSKLLIEWEREHEYGVTNEDFGRISVVDRKHAANNPAAWFYQRPITLEEHQASR